MGKFITKKIDLKLFSDLIYVLHFYNGGNIQVIKI